MFKKVIISILLTLTMILGFNVARATAYASDGTETTGLTGNEKVVSFSLEEQFKSGYTANTPVVFTDGENEIGTLTVSKDSSKGISSHTFKLESVFTFVPNNEYIVKSFFWGVSSNTTFGFKPKTDESTGNIVAKDPTDEELELLSNNCAEGVNLSNWKIHGVGFDGSSVTTENEIYVFEPTHTLKFGTIFLIYEKCGYSATVYPRSGNYDSIDAGPFKINISQIGYPGVSGVTMNESSRMVISHAPGYVINSIVLTTDTSEALSLWGEPAFSYEKTDEKTDGSNKINYWTLTDFPISSTYTIRNNPDHHFYLKSVTINYDDHVHDEVFVPSYDDTYHFNQCSCFLRTNEEEHEYNEPSITPPTLETLGESRATCKHCDYVKVEELKLDIANADVKLLNELVYNGGITLTQQVEVSYEGTVIDASNYTIINHKNSYPGTYTLKIFGKNMFAGTKDVEYTINKASVAKPVADSTVFIYNGQSQTYTLATSSLYTISNASQKNAGTYTVSVTLKSTKNAAWEDGTTDPLSYDFVINKATYNMDAVVFEDSTVTYDGNTYSLAIEGTLPNGVTVSYENNAQTNAGEYVVTAKFTGDANNYNAIADMTAILTIEKATYDMSAISMANKTVTYDGNTYSLAIEGTLPDGVTVSYENNAQTNAGEYVVTAKFTGNANYNDIADKTATLTIEKAVVTAPTADDTVFTYNGQEQTYVLETSDLYNVLDNTATIAGNHTVKVALKDKNNYKWNNGNSNDIEYSFVINKATYNMDSVVFEDKTVTYNGNAQSLAIEGVLPNGVTVTYENNVGTNAGTYNAIAKFTGDANNYELIANKTAVLTIKQVVVTAPIADDSVFTYNGQEQTYVLETSSLYNVLDNTATIAGNHTVKVALIDKNNYQWNNGNSNDLTYSFVINKATYNMDGVVFANKTVIYNGNAQSLAIEGVLPNGVTVTYENNGKTDAGVYTVTAKFIGNTNYNDIADKTAKLTINKATYNMDGVVFANKTVTYNGSAFSIEATNLPNGVTVTYENNGKINVGEYTITAKFTGNVNYNDIADKTAKLIINKATYNMDGVVFANRTVVYSGSAFSIEATNLPNGVSATYENNGKINVGEYVVTAKFTGNANYNAIANKTATLTIEKAVVTAPTADNTAFTYNGQAQTYALQGNVLYTISNTTFTNAGSYNIAVALVDKNNYKWNNGNSNDLTYSFVINKATYNMNGVVFANKTVVYNGSAFNVEATNLPNGVTVTYENNGKTDAGVYTVTAKFTGDANNYELIADKTATLTINKALISFDTNNEDDIANDIIISSNDGIDPTKELVVKLVESEKPAEDYKDFISKTQKVAVSYDVKLLKDGISVQPDGTLQFKVLIPAELVGKNFDIIHIHNGNEVSVLEYQIDGDYVTFESDKLSEFVFVYDMGSILWVIIVLGVVALLEIAFLVFLSKKNKEIKSKKLMSAYPPFLFGMFIAEWEIVLAIVLVVVVIVLAIVSIIFATKVLNTKTQDATESEEVSVTKDTIVEQIVEDEDDDNDEKEGRIVKSFSERLSNCSLETINYYNDIKNELLSYKKVKSKISFKHESFRFGMPVVARLKIRGKSLYLFLALDPNDYIDTKYKIKDMSAISNSKDVPTMYKINLPRRVIYAKELIKDLMENIKAEKNN